jgi:hypothetical protein
MAAVTITPQSPFTTEELARLNQQMLSGDVMSAADAAEKLAELESAVDQTWHISVYDRFWQKVGELGEDLIELGGKDPRNKMSAATLKVKGSSWLTDTFMACQKTMVGVTVETAGIRFSFYVDTFDYEFQDGAWVGTASLNGVYDILNFILIWPSWWSPIQIQLFSHAIYIGGLCMCIEAMVSENSLRLQSGIWEFINNAASLNPDVRTWFGTLLQSKGNIFQMLKTPVYVVRTNPLLDTSPLICRTVRMETCGVVIEDITRAYGVDVRVDLWLPGDDQPDYWTKNFEAMALTQPTYVVTVKDRSQITGPTGTVIDSAVRQIVDVSGSFFGEILGVIEQAPGRDGVFISELLGVDYVEPWALLIAPEPGEKGNVVTCRLSFHTPKGWQHVIGGRSPKWVVALSGDRGGNHPGQPLTQRPDERHLRVAHRLARHSDRVHRHPQQPPRGIPEQHAAGVPADAELRPAQRRRPLPSGDRGRPRHVQRALQHRNRVRLHQCDVGFTRMDVGDRHVPQRGGVHAGQGRVPRWADLAAVHGPHPGLHRLHRRGSVQDRRHASRYSLADRRRKSRGVTTSQASALHYRTPGVHQRRVADASELKGCCTMQHPG